MSEGIIQKHFKKYIVDIHRRGGEYEREDVKHAEQLLSQLITDIIENRNGDHGENYILLNVLIGRNK